MLMGFNRNLVSFIEKFKNYRFIEHGDFVNVKT